MPNDYIVPGDIPPAFVGGSELSFLICLIVALFTLGVAALTVGIFF
jgi:hypothetical protein